MLNTCRKSPLGNGGTIQDRTVSYGNQHSPACCRRNSEKGPSRKRKEERMKKIEDKFDAGDYTLVEYLSVISRWVGF